MFYLADIFTLGVQYGGRSELCNLMETIDSKTIQEKMTAIQQYGDSKNCFIKDYDARSLQDISLGTTKNIRQWTYQYCTEFGWYQIPNSQHPMRSNYIKSEFWPDYCKRIFGSELPPLDIEGTNLYYGGMNIQGSNIYFINAGEDPW